MPADGPSAARLRAHCVKEIISMTEFKHEEPEVEEPETDNPEQEEEEDDDEDEEEE
jgi:hypothetical protein